MINRLRIRALLAVPAVFLAALLPAAFAGRSLLSQLMTYPAQITDGGGGGGGGQLGGSAGGARVSGGGFGGGGFGGRSRLGHSVSTGNTLTDNAPTWYAWLPANASSVWTYVGLGLAAAVAITFAVILIRRRRMLSAAEILLVAAASTLIIPLLLPQMHERYFYLAEVLTVLAIFVGRGWIAVAACIEAASVSTYLSYLNGTTSIPLGLAALAAMSGAVLAAVLLLRRLRPYTHRRERGLCRNAGGGAAVVGDPARLDARSRRGLDPTGRAERAWTDPPTEPGS